MINFLKENFHWIQFRAVLGQVQNHETASNDSVEEIRLQLKQYSIFTENYNDF